MNLTHDLKLALGKLEKPAAKKILITGNQRTETLWHYLVHKKFPDSDFNISSTDFGEINFAKANIAATYITGNIGVNLPYLYQQLANIDLAVLCLNEFGSFEVNMSTLKKQALFIRSQNEHIPIILVCTPLNHTDKIIISHEKINDFAKEINALAYYDCTGYDEKTLENVCVKIIAAAYATELNAPQNCR